MAAVTSEDISVLEDFSEQVDIDIEMALETYNTDAISPLITFAKPQGTWPNVTTIDFGDGYLRANGRKLRGKILLSETADIRTPGAVRTISYDNFSIDSIRMEGSRSCTNNGQNGEGQWYFTKTAHNIKLMFRDGTTATWNKQYTTVLIEGGDTATGADNVWSSTGASSGSNRGGHPFTATITEPLIKKADCRWIATGVLDVEVEGEGHTLDFGNGSCDRFTRVYMPSGESFMVLLRR